MEKPPSPLIVILHRLEERLRMEARRTSLWRVVCLDDISAVTALPPNLPIALEEVAVSNAVEQF